jgi:hypothetical protein
LADDGRCCPPPAILVRRDGDGAAIPLTRPLFSRLPPLPLLALPEVPILGIIDLRDLGIRRRGGALLLLPLLTLAPPLGSPDGLDDEDGMVGGLLLTEPRV